MALTSAQGYGHHSRLGREEVPGDELRRAPVCESAGAAGWLIGRGMARSNGDFSRWTVLQLQLHLKKPARRIVRSVPVRASDSAVSAVGLFRDNLSFLLGRSPGPDQLARVEAEARSVEGGARCARCSCEVVSTIRPAHMACAQVLSQWFWVAVHPVCWPLSCDRQHRTELGNQEHQSARDRDRDGSMTLTDRDSVQSRQA